MKTKKGLLLTIYIILNLFAVLIGSYLETAKVITTIYYSRILIVLLIINLIIIISSFVFKFIKKEKISIDKIDILIYLIIFFGFMSSIYAVNVRCSFYGFRYRNEGFFQIMYYFTILFLTTFVEKEYKKKIVYTILLCGFIEAVYAILQKTQWLPVYTQFQHDKPWASAFVVNPNFLGSLMVICLGYSIGLFIDLSKKLYKVLSLLLVLLFMVCLLLTNTLSGIVGLIVVLMYLFIYCIVNKKKLLFLILIILLSSTTLIMTKYRLTGVLGDLNRTKNQSIEIAKGNVEDRYGSNRMFIWKNTIKKVPDYLILGAGIDNFYYVFGREPLILKNYYIDKAHNEYLQVLICQGVLALICYLLLYAIITLKGIKNSFKNKEVLLILPVIGYLVQAFFNISIIEVAPFFYIALGLCVDRNSKNKDVK